MREEKTKLWSTTLWLVLGFQIFLLFSEWMSGSHLTMAWEKKNTQKMKFTDFGVSLPWLRTNLALISCSSC